MTKDPMKVLSSTSQSTCYICSRSFTRDDIGSLSCRIHPIVWAYSSVNCLGNERNKTLPCCGIPVGQISPPKTNHFDNNGCHRIDHVQTRKDLLEIIKKPYVTIPVHESQSLEICKQRVLSVNKKKSADETEQRIIPVLDWSHLNYDYVFKIPGDSSITISIEDEYQKIQKDLNLDEEGLDANYPSKPSTKSIPYTEYYSYPEDNDQIESKGKGNLSGTKEFKHPDFINAFIPFYIIRRMSYQSINE